MTELLPHQQRVVEERDALREKINKLTETMASPMWSLISGDERNLLVRQLRAMVNYCSILGERLRLWGAV